MDIVCYRPKIIASENDPSDERVLTFNLHVCILLDCATFSHICKRAVCYFSASALKRISD